MGMDEVAEGAFNRKDLLDMGGGVLAFDCAHYDDLPMFGGIEKDLDWVRNELKAVCRNLQHMEQGLEVKLQGKLPPPQENNHGS